MRLIWAFERILSMKNIEIEIKHWPIARLFPSPTNPRIHSPEQIEQIARSIQQFGFVNPILVGEDRQIIAGEGRFRAAATEDARGSGNRA